MKSCKFGISILVLHKFKGSTFVIETCDFWDFNFSFYHMRGREPKLEEKGDKEDSERRMVRCKLLVHT